MIGENDSIYKFYARDAKKNQKLSNEDLLIFFLCNFKIYVVYPSPENLVEFVDTTSKIKSVDINTLVYIPLKNQKSANYIKLLKISFSDYFITKLYEEFDGKLIDFHIE